MQVLLLRGLAYFLDETRDAIPVDKSNQVENIKRKLSVIDSEDLHPPPHVKPLSRGPNSQKGGSRYVGVNQKKGSDRWQSMISFKSFQYHLGTFESKWDAGAASA